MWWRPRGPAERWWVHRSAGTILWWSCHSLLKQWECSHSWQPCHRSLLNGHGVLPKGDHHLWPRFSPGSHQNPTSTWQVHNQLQTHLNVVISKITVLFLMAQRHRVHAFKMTKAENNVLVNVMFSCVNCLLKWDSTHKTLSYFYSAFTITHRKYSPTRAVKDYTIHWREVAKNAFMYLHVLVGRWRQNLAKTSCACSLPCSHCGHFTRKTRTIRSLLG